MVMKEYEATYSHVHIKKRIQVTLNLLTDADRSTDTKKSPKKNMDASFLLKIVSSHANIRNTPFDQKSPQHPEVGVLRLQAKLAAFF